MSGTEPTSLRLSSMVVRAASLALGLLALASVTVGCDNGAEPPPRESGGGAPTEVVRGEELARQSCTACHGQDFEGIGGLGTSLQDNVFIQEHTDDQLVAFIKEGRANDAPDNETGISMPPYGGNTQLTDDGLSDIVVFLRTLQ